MAGSRRRTLDDRGSAIVEFTLVSTLLLFLFMGIFQLGLALYFRNTLVACAAEGARYGANADRSPADAAAKAAELIAQSLPDSYADAVSAGTTTVAGAPTVYVEVAAEFPLVGWLASGGRFTVRAHALDEG